MYVFSINSSHSNGNVLGVGGWGWRERYIINYCRPYARSDLLTEKRVFSKIPNFSKSQLISAHSIADDGGFRKFFFSSNQRTLHVF